jgi:hypothetical protein
LVGQRADPPQAPAADERRPFHQATVALGLRLDVSNIGEALEVLEGPTVR